jgi:hypothetical protein
MHPLYDFNNKSTHLGTFDIIDVAYIAYHITANRLNGGGFQMPDVDSAHQQQRRA